MKYFIFSIVLFLVSCNTSKTFTARSQAINNKGVMSRPVVVDLDVKALKVSGEANGTTKDGITELSRLAVKEALAPMNADVLIEPQYEYETSGRDISVKVKGYPATFKNFRPMNNDEYKIYLASDSFRVLQSQIVNNKEIKKGGKKKKARFDILLNAITPVKLIF